MLKNKGLYENNEMGHARYIVCHVAASAWLLAERNGAAVSPPPSASAKSDAATKQPAPIPLPDRKVQTVAPNGKCVNLHPAADMEDLMRQIVANLDSPCLFAYSPKELEQV